ncbi:MAG: hypothetical protein M1457_00265, partial [bacterium]|nr:hypothetical protein [bacterium]
LRPGRPTLVLDANGQALSVARPGAPDSAGESESLPPDESVAENDTEPDPVASEPLGATELVFRPIRVLARP